MESKYQELKERVLKQNLRLVELGLVTLTWGNASEIDRVQGVIAIKPSGVAYEDMKADDIVIVDLNGQVVEGHLKPAPKESPPPTLSTICIAYFLEK